MHALTEKPCNGPRTDVLGRPNQTRYAVVMPFSFDLRRNSRQSFLAVARIVAANVTLFCNGFRKQCVARQMRASTLVGGVSRRVRDRLLREQQASAAAEGILYRTPH